MKKIKLEPKIKIGSDEDIDSSINTNINIEFPELKQKHIKPKKPDSIELF